jgi:hypothetical protein
VLEVALQAMEDLLRLARVLRDHDDVERRAILDEDLALAVEDEPARGAHALQPHAVALGEIAVFLACTNLQMPDPRADEDERREDDRDRREDSPPEPTRKVAPFEESVGESVSHGSAEVEPPQGVGRKPGG